MSNLLKELSSNNQTMRAASQERQKAAQMYREAKQERRAIKSEFIGKAFDTFLQDMRTSWRAKDYEKGIYSGVFTKHVARIFGWRYSSEPQGFNQAHTDALIAYRDAYRNLNKTFLDCCQNYPEDMRNTLTDRANLKNLGKIRDYDMETL